MSTVTHIHGNANNNQTFNSVQESPNHSEQSLAKKIVLEDEIEMVAYHCEKTLNQEYNAHHTIHYITLII